VGGKNPHGCETPMGYMSHRPSHRSSLLYLAQDQCNERRVVGMTKASALRCVNRFILPSALFGGCIGALESLIKGGAARAIFVTVSFFFFFAQLKRMKTVYR